MGAIRDMLNGLAPGSRVIVAAASTEKLLQAYNACWDLRLVAVPLDPSSPPTFQTHVIQHAQPHAMVREDGTTVCGGPWTESPPGDAFIVYTSGTTGAPKGVVLTRAACEYNARAVAELHGLRPGVKHITCLPLHHCNAIMMSWLACKLTGAINIHAPRRIHAFIDTARASHAEMGNIAPALLTDMVRTRQPWPSTLRYLLTAAAPLPRSLARAFRDLYGPGRLRQGYGMSEAVNFSFTMPDLQGAAWDDAYCERDPGVGVPVGDTEWRIVDGEVQVRGSSLMRCYWHDPDATAAAFDDGWLRTGDLGEERDGILVLTGRRKEIINRGGEKLSPLAVEEAYRLAGIRGVFAVVPSYCPRLGEDVALAGQLPPLGFSVKLDHRLRPAAATDEPVAHTSTGKPQRGSVGLVSMALPEIDYTSLAAAVRPLARVICDRLSPGKGQAGYLHRQAVMLKGAELEPALAMEAPAVIRAALEELESGIRDREELSGIYRRLAPLWERLMVEAPMGHYAQMAADFMMKRGLHESPVILELGAGVGNFSRLIKSHAGRYIRTDAHQRFLDGRWSSDEMVLDFDEPLPDLPKLNCVVAVNALHCAKAPRDVIKALHRAMAPGGTLILAEGKSYPWCAPWALNLIYGFFDGWWDRGGFRTRQYWLDAMHEAKFSSRGYSVLRAGHYDLGGLVWAVK